MITVTKRSSKSGLPPGTLVHVGKTRTGKIKITKIEYDKEKISEKTVENIDNCFPIRNAKNKNKGTTWINIDGIHNPEIISKLGKHLDINSLILEDIMNSKQRPKIEEYEKYIYLVLRLIYFSDKGELLSEQISLILGKNYVISLQETEGDIFDIIRERIRTGKGRVRKEGADYLAYLLMDTIVDNYFYIIEEFSSNMEEIEDDLLKETGSATLQNIYEIKRELTELKKSIWPLREVITKMERMFTPIITNNTKFFLRDLHDHAIQIIDNTETLRDRASGMIDIYLSSISYKMNEVMKVLTIISTIFMPLTFIVGLYGMNVHIPEASLKNSYFYILGAIVIIAASMLIYFKKKKWI